MRRISPAFALAALVCFPALAGAADHRQRISEVLLSDDGNDAIQYIEMSNGSGDNFPGTYFLGVYDADGTPLGTVNLGPPTKPLMLVSTAEADEAFGVEGDDELTVALPTEGQVCFERVGSGRISCMSWGCVSDPLSGTGVFPQDEGAAPPDGQSIQLQGNGTYQLANPTPDANNAAGEAAPACPTDPDAGPGDIDAGSGGDADGGPDGPDGGGGSGDGGDGDDDSGCGCRASSPRDAAGGLVLFALFVVVGRSRRLRGNGRHT